MESAPPIPAATTGVEESTVENQSPVEHHENQPFSTEDEENPIAEALNHIALSHFKKGNFEGALLMFQECLDTKRKSCAGDHLSIADTLNNMAIVQNCQVLSL